MWHGNFHHHHQRRHLLGLHLLTMSVCISAIVSQASPKAPSPTAAAPTAKNATTASPPKPKSQLSLDYEYQDTGTPIDVGSPHGGPHGGKPGIKTPAAGGGGQREEGMFYPLYGEAMRRGEGMIPPSGHQEGWQKGPPMGIGMGGEPGERYEWLRERVRKLRRFGLKDELETLQKHFPKVNLTLMYSNPYGYGEEGYEMDEGGYWYNGTYYRSPGGYGEMEDGYWHNGTFYPGEMEGPEMEDGYYYNGTYYPGEMEGPEMEDGYYYNGTYYPGEMEGPEMEDGYVYNGTFYPGYEQEGYEQEGPEQEDLMWWQLHHPRWRDGGVNNVHETKQQLPPPPHVQHPHQPPMRKWEGFPVVPLPPVPPRQHLPPPQQQLPPHMRPGPQIPPPQPRPKETIPNLPQRLPMVQHGQHPAGAPHGRHPPQRLNPPGRGNHPSHPQRHSDPLIAPGNNQQGGKLENPMHAKMVGGAPQQQQGGSAPGLPGSAGVNGGNIGVQPGSAGVNGGNMGVPPVGVSHPGAAGPGASLHGGGNPGGAARLENQPLTNTYVREQSSPLDPYRMSTTVTWGIVIASIIGVTVILAPLACMLYKYRQDKRIKKRTFLKRSELGSVDEGIMDAMVMSELGEKKGSRVQKIGRGGERGRKADSYWDAGARHGSSSQSFSLSRARSELRSERQKTPMGMTVYADDDPEIIIT